MRELTVKIKYNNDTADFNAFDIQCALTSLFGINTDFKVEEIKPQKRKENRVGIAFAAECIVSDEKNFNFTTVSSNLSSQGIKILSRSFLAPKQKLKLNLNLIDKIAKIQTQVIWCDKINGSQDYYAGLKFVELAEEDKEDLRRFLNQ